MKACESSKKTEKGKVTYAEETQTKKRNQDVKNHDIRLIRVLKVLDSNHIDPEE